MKILIFCILRGPRGAQQQPFAAFASLVALKLHFIALIAPMGYRIDKFLVWNQSMKR